jgi:signal transduction histidine kinase
MSVSTYLELGERYAALGLPSAARGAFMRALEAASDGDPTPARRLAELALARGDGPAAREHARELVARDPGASAQVLLGRAHVLAGELAAARLALGRALETAGVSALIKARAHLSLAAVALAEGDHSGAAANAMASMDELGAFAVAPDRSAVELDAELPLAEEITARAVALGRAADATQVLAELGERKPEAPIPMLVPLLLAARQSHGDTEVKDVEIEEALARALAGAEELRNLRLFAAQRKLRRRYRDSAARRQAIEELEAIAESMEEAETGVHENVTLARVYFLLAAAYEDDPASAAKAENAYRRGLELRPGHAAAVNRLALLTLARGDREAALAEIERSLRIDSEHGLVWRNAARVVGATAASSGDPAVVGRLLDAANPGAGAAAGEVAPRLVTATAEVTRGEVLAGMYTRGHRLKNLLGIIGSRTRSARKLTSDEELGRRLGDLERDVTALYDEWSQYLRSMQTAGPVIEVVPMDALIREVVSAAEAASGQLIQLNVSGALPDIRGDRMLLREALLNLVSNAAEACAPVGGSVSVSARDFSGGDTRLIEVTITDTGPGIPRAQLGKVFAPGYTTKETGSGVGLAIAERVVSAHHGRISIDSEEGQGTRVSVVLPSDLGGFAGLASYSSDTEVE